ncbi:Lipoate synthase [Clostridiaceae bacterium JG1575]|nr:Lipoate synthase [Clostridiaceae bacterium JG1575]
MKRQKPEWLKVPFNQKAVHEVSELLAGAKVNTVCKEANCPNLGECYAKKTATFMVMGNSCTRNCRFCNVTCDRPQALDPQEPQHVADVARKLGLRHVVVTQVTRDDLTDGGAQHMADTVRAIRSACPEATIEVLISDLQGNEEALATVLASKPDVMNHNVEMVERLYPDIRPQARYERSLGVLNASKRLAPDVLTKTGFMVGLGETDEEVDQLMEDVRATGCDILTVSQYLQPSVNHYPLKRFVPPAQFDRYREAAMAKGFRFVASSPLVRSSYRAAEALEASRKERAGGCGALRS